MPEARPGEGKTHARHTQLKIDPKHFCDRDRFGWVFVLWPEVFIEDNAGIVFVIDVNLGHLCAQPLPGGRRIFQQGQRAIAT